MDRLSKLFLAVFVASLSIAQAAFQGQTKRDGEAQAALMLSLVRQNRLPEAATQIFNLAKKEFSPKSKFDHQNFDMDYLYNKIPLPKYDEYVRVPFNPKTLPGSYFLFVIDSYFLRAAVIKDTRRYVDFLVNVVLENKDSRPIIGSVLDTIMYRFPGQQGIDMASDLLIKHSQANPDNDIFWHLDPMNKPLINALPLDMQVKLLTQYLKFDHRFAFGKDYSYHYELF